MIDITKYIQIYNEIKEKIQNGDYEENTLLPYEKDLQTEYGVSRGTIRQSLELLESEGYIQKVKGRGSVVLPRHYNFSMNSLISFKEISENMNAEVETRVVNLELMSATEFLAKQLEVSEKEKVWKVERLRIINGKPSILDTDYFLQKIVSTLSLRTCQGSIYSYIENELKVSPTVAHKIITIEKSSEREQDLLNIKDDDVLAVVRSKVYNENNVIFQYSTSKHKSEIFEFSSVARR